jgi:hypothetical protein
MAASMNILSSILIIVENVFYKTSVNILWNSSNRYSKLFYITFYGNTGIMIKKRNSKVEEWCF